MPSGSSGGGSSGGSGGGGPPPPTAESFRTQEYLTSWALDAIDAAKAYALGYTGEGVTIGIVDFNFDFTGNEVRYTGASLGADTQAVAWYEAVIGETVDNLQHGHAVAATAAAVKNDSEIQGVAFDARVLAVDYFARVNETIVSQGAYNYHVSDPWDYFASHAVKIINKSYGYDDGDTVEVPDGITEIYVNAPEAIAIENGAVLIASAGNNGGSNPMLSNRDIVDDINTYDLQDGPGAFMIVGSLRQTASGYEISSFSNRAGDYADYFITAPGEDVVFPLNAPECAPSYLCVGSGTSFSAPLVSGAAALILERWPNLSGREIADILFASATDLGDPGIDPVYGHGMLNVYAALQPIGETTLGVPGGIAATAQSSGLILGEALGDAPALNAALATVPIRDSFDRDFGIDLSPFVWAHPRSDVAGLIEQKTRWNGAAYRLGFHATVSVQLYDEPAVPFAPLNGLEEPDSYRGVVQFSGIFDGSWGKWSWKAGTGLGLGTVLAGSEATQSIAPLTRAFSGMLESQTGQYATIGMAVNDRTRISFGVAHARTGNFPGHYLEALNHGSSLGAAAVRLDYVAAKFALDFELGSSFEKGAVLGSYGTGALTLAESGTTAWTKIGGEFPLGSLWSLRGAASFVFSEAARKPGSLVAAFGPIFSTSASFGVERTGVFVDCDTLTVTIHQPLRVEHAPITLFAASVDEQTGVPVVSKKRLSLTPSGREIGFELSYGTFVGRWHWQSGFAYRLDTGHLRGKSSTSLFLWISRPF